MSFEVVYNTALKIYSKLYVGVKPTGTDKTPLAFATPYTEDAAGLKRQATVKSWVGSTRYDYATRKSISFEPDIRVVENIARSGFKITDDIKRVYWGGGNVVWRLEDPLGWEIEIQSSNLMALIQAVGISPGGVIGGECVIARDGAHNVLLPVTSQEYKDAIKAAESVKAPGKVPAKDRVIGRFYRLASGEFGQYMGKMFIRTGEQEYYPSRSYESYLSFKDGDKVFNTKASTINEVIHNSIKMELYDVVYVPEHNATRNDYTYKIGGTSKLYKSAPLVAELDQGAITKEEAEVIVNENSMNWAGSSVHGTPIYASLIDDCNIQFTTVPAPKSVYTKVRKDVLEKAKQRKEQYEHQSSSPVHRQYAKEPLKFSLADLLHSYSAELEYQAEDGNIYTKISLIDMAAKFNSWNQPNLPRDESRVLAVAGRCVIGENRLQRITLQHGYEMPREASSTQWYSGMVTQQYDTIDELMAACDKLFEEGRLVQIRKHRVTI